MSVSTRTVIVRLAPPLDAKLTRLATKRRVSRSELIRTALIELKERGGSSLDSIADLVGAVDGPRDLSTNPKHMEGFGHDRPRRRSHRRSA
ncbi:MAG: CopG family transcriptional regulator [Polyangiaceae bacterium]